MAHWADSKIVEHGCGVIGFIGSAVIFCAAVAGIGYLLHLGWNAAS